MKLREETLAFYGRFSTDEQNPRSIPDQRRRCGAVAEHHGYNIVVDFEDAGISGTHTERPGLQAMLDQLARTKGRAFRGVIVDDLTRLSRNQADAWRILDELETRGVVLIDAQTGIRSDQPNARMMFSVAWLVGEQSAIYAAYATHRGLDSRAKDGFSTGGSIYGYRSEQEAGDPKHARWRRVIDEDEAIIVRRIFKEYLDGASYKSIAERLNHERIPEPRNNGRGRKHGPGWGHTSVRSILSNPKYVGSWTWNTRRKVRVPGRGRKRQLARPAEEHVTREMPELAIIDRATWDAVQARLARMQRKGSTGGRPPGDARPYLVSGLLKCGVCGGPMSIASQKTKNEIRYANFGCTSYRSRGASICSNNTTISERKITADLVEAIRETLTSEVIDSIVRGFERRLAERSKAPSKPSNTERALKEAETRVRNLTSAIAKRPELEALYDQLADEQSCVKRLRAELASQRPTQAPRVAPYRAQVRKAVAGFLTKLGTVAPGEGREILAGICTPITVTRNAKTPGAYEATGALRVCELVRPSSGAGVFANVSSGGGVCTSFYAMSRTFSAVWHLAVGRCR